MGGVQKLGPCVKLVIVLALVMSASDGAGASRPLMVMRAAAGKQQQQSTNGYGGVLASVKLAVVIKMATGRVRIGWSVWAPKTETRI
jgi:hypothetical protein